MAFGDIVLANSKKGFMPRAIKWFTGSFFSHSLVKLPDMLSLPMCIEAAEGGVDAVRFDLNYENDLNQGYQVWRLCVSDVVKVNALQTILTDLEITYGFLQYPWFIWRRICKLFGLDIRSRSNWSSQGMICSQLCVQYLRECHLEDLFHGYGVGSLAPQDLQDIFKANPELFELVQEVRM